MKPEIARFYFLTLVLLVFGLGAKKSKIKDGDTLYVDDINGTIFAYSFTGILSVKGLCIAYSNVESVEDGALCSSPFQKIELCHNEKFSVLQKTHFGHCPSLNTLTIVDNSNMTIAIDAFSNLAGLTELHLKNQKVPLLTRDSFTNLKSLERLKIQECGVDLIEVDAFDSLHQLKVLTLRGNNIKNLNGRLMYLSQLRQLTIVEKLNYFPSDDISYLVNLKSLDISCAVNYYDVDKITSLLELKYVAVSSDCRTVDDGAITELKSRLRNVEVEVFDQCVLELRATSGCHVPLISENKVVFFGLLFVCTESLELLYSY